MKLSEAIALLKKNGVPDAKRDAMEIFEKKGNIRKSEMLIGDVECSDSDVICAVKERAERKPLQYILGKVYFYNEEYEVDENCLIPRSDTEILVDYAVKNIPQNERFLDLCTGSGCVGISTLKNTRDTTAVLVDISHGAIDIAKRNAKLNGVLERAEFLQKDVTADAVCGEYFAVLSNPPYVTDSAYETLEGEIYFEPKIAFVGGTDGADFYRKITPLYKNIIKKGGFIAYEIGFDQGEILKNIAEEECMTCEIIKDFSGNDRVAVLKNK